MSTVYLYVPSSFTRSSEVSTKRECKVSLLACLAFFHDVSPEASSSGVEQVIHSFIHGTNDLKALLLQHTDVIFECKVGSFNYFRNDLILQELPISVPTVKTLCETQGRVQWRHSAGTHI